jgi:hypothetical protein
VWQFLEVPEDQADHVCVLVADAMLKGFMRMFDAEYMLEDLVESGVGETWADAK